jgi:hypothetical protein
MEKNKNQLKCFAVNNFFLSRSGMIVSSTLVSVLSVLLVAVDRFLYILYGLQYQRYIYPNRSRILIMTTWIFGELLAVFGFGFVATLACKNLVSKSIYIRRFYSINSKTILIEFSVIKTASIAEGWKVSH